jgi:FkbM family methyltransferase
MSENTPTGKLRTAVSNRLRLLRYTLHRRLGGSTIRAHTEWGAALDLKFSDVSTAYAIFFGTYEEEEVKKIFKYIKRGMTVFDIGAHIGYFTLLMAHLVGPDGLVFAFEPNPITYAQLKSNIAINPHLNDGRIEILRTALGEDKSVQSFFCPVSGSEGLAGLKDTKRALINEVIEVQVDTLDNFAVTHNVKKIDFVKMDIEGAEYDVLKGSEKVLNELHPIILFEACELNTKPYGYRVFEELHYLEQRGYVVKQAGFSYDFIAISKSENENCC